ncbi:hypothetical protein P170DRAFT_357196 [Aspergillus steynii IBT 23096]|uniref:Uncharacterized protein n=1 Tax=Aspergillus steynii IBT 23096 TaxID=1392250 RepID=A0A2I2G9A0_9EURO|nr:uncharacterized protein P170DRAFT_357196 [Aspergillus steynii IBT 23096]PLB49449.1 hypothetical protein P170DRAFT_357196 [Aspergillus steynii IBT 23096]
MAMVTIDRPSVAPPVRVPAPPASDPPSSRRPSTSPGNSEVIADPNIANPRLLTNRACIYERRLPGDAYITAHVQRLQHGFYASSAVSDHDSDHVDFLGINFVFHSPNTMTHRFKAATIRASIHSSRDKSLSSAPATRKPSRRSSCSHDHRTPPRPRNPRFLKHAPHLLYGAMSPETLQWNYSLAGSIGVAQLPLMASLSPSGGMNGRYRRYEMMRIQGSVRSLKSPRGHKFDVEAGEIVWTLEENSLQRSGLPREFTFAMLIQKPHADSRVRFSLDIDPVLQFGCCTYPGWWLDIPKYQPAPRRPLDFRIQVGQRFEPITSSKGFNFATLESSFDDYVHMPGRKFSSMISPDGGGVPQDDNEIRRDVTRDLSMVEPVRGPARPPYSIEAGQLPLAAAFPGKIPVNQALVPMVPGFDPGSFSIRVLLDDKDDDKESN